MNKIAIFLLCIMSAFCFAVAFTESQTIEALPVLYTQSAPLVVNIRGNYRFEMFQGVTAERDSWGSGFIIDSKKGWIVTAHHVDALEKKKITLPSGKIAACETIAEDKENDIVIIKVAPSLLRDCKEVELSMEAYVGETIYSVNFASGFNYVIVSGILSTGVNYEIKNYEFEKYSYPDGFYISDMYVTGGGSGSPAFNLEGKVIGIISARYDGYAVIVPATSIQNLINSINSINN